MAGFCFPEQTLGFVRLPVSFDIIVRAALLFTGRPQSYAEVVMQENERTKMMDRSAERLGEMRRYL